MLLADEIMMSLIDVVDVDIDIEINVVDVMMKTRC